MRIREERKCFNFDKLFQELFRCRLDERVNWTLLCKSCLDDSKKITYFINTAALGNPKR